MRAANIAPTEGYMYFDLAERLGQTVRQVLSGESGPLLQIESYMWNRYHIAQARLRQQQESGKKR